MRWPIIQAVLQKEVLEQIRDRRTVISMILVPMLLLPAMMIGAVTLIPRLMQSGADRAKARPVPMRLLASSEAGLGMAIREALEAEGMQVVDAEPGRDLRAEVSSQSSVVAIEELAGEKPDDAPRLEVIFDAPTPASSSSASDIAVALNKVRDQQVRASLQAQGVSDKLLDPFIVSRENAANQRRTTGALWGSMLGYLLILMMFSGGMYPIMDMTAGEKERKTLEAFLASPAKRSEIVLGKTLSAILAILMTSALMLASMVISLQIGARMTSGADAGSQRLREMLGTVPLDGGNLVLLAATLIPLALLGASAMFTISLGARSFKEAQTYLTPMLFIVIIPGLLGGLPGFESSPILSLVPILNASQVIRAILVGDVQMLNFGITTVANLVYAGIALFIATRMFQREQVLFRT